MKFYLKGLILIIILSAITKISFSHEFWIHPKNYHLSNNEKAIANIFKKNTRIKNRYNFIILI